MATVLLGWELGGGLGHVQRLIKVARELAAQGHDPILALKTLVEPWPAVRDLPFPIVQAPQGLFADVPGFRAGTFADILAIRGYTDPEAIAPLVASWEGLIAETKARLVVGDFAPTLSLAAYGKWPAVMIGNGFALPPANGPVFPPLHRDGRPNALEVRMLNVIREVQRRRGLPGPETLPGLFSQAVPFVCSLPELDPYRNFRPVGFAAPLASLPPPSPPPSEQAFFAYLATGEEALAKLIQGLATAGLKGSAYIRGASSSVLNALRRPGLHLHEQPPSLADVLPRAGLVIHHSGLGVSEAALAVGRPQLLLPQHLEQELTAQALIDLGVGRVLSNKAEPTQVVRLATEMAGDRNLVATAQARAVALAARGVKNVLPAIVTECCRWLH